MHHKRWRRHGDPATVLPAPGRPFAGGTEHPNWRGDDAGYAAIHRRLRDWRGQEHHCGECGAADAPRVEWALDWRKEPEVVFEQDRRGHLLAFSRNLDDYVRMCMPCHGAFDYAHRQKVAA